MSDIKIGNRKVIFFHTFIVSIHEKVSFHIQEDKFSLNVTLSFREKEHDEKIAAEWISTDDENLSIVFYGVTKGHLRIMQFPARLGNFDGETLSFSASFQRNTDVLLSHVQFMLGGDCEQW